MSECKEIKNQDVFLITSGVTLVNVSMTAADATVYTPQWIDFCNIDECLPMDCSQLAARQARLSKPELQDLQGRIVGPRGILAAFSIQVAEQGRQAPYLQILPESTDPTRLMLAEKALEFALGCQQRRASGENPFADLPRASLCCIVYDDLGPYNLAERYAASEELRTFDGQFFARLIATTHETVERRVVFKGLLEHFDALLPVEQSIYPEGYRDVQQRYLEREERLYGTLTLDKPLSEIFAEQTPESLLVSLGARG
jgi:hypothetical protein